MLTNIPLIPGLKELFCSNCPLLTYISLISGLKTLNCYNCPLLTNIPLIEGLKILNCCNCQLITNIPLIAGLEELFCNCCSLLTNIPLIEGLQTLNCSDCPILTKIPFIQVRSYEMYRFNCSNCKWLKESNQEYENNIKKVKHIQEFMRKIILSRRLIVLIQKIVPIYYHPDCKGGYIHKKQMLVDLQRR